jgi:purine-binding chemotaxis protein CheW
MAKGKTSTTINSLLRLASLPLKLGEEQAREVNADQLSFLVFEIQGDCFAISVEQIEGIVDSPRITPLPNAPDGVIGVTSVRGRMTLTMSFGSPDQPNKNKQRLILLKGDLQLGLLADRIDDVITVLAKDLHKIAKHKKASTEGAPAIAASKYYLQRKDRMITVLDVEQFGEA